MSTKAAEQTVTSSVPDSTLETHFTGERLPPTDSERKDVRENQKDDYESSYAFSIEYFVMTTDMFAKKRSHESKAKARMLYTPKEIILR